MCHTDYKYRVHLLDLDDEIMEHVVSSYEVFPFRYQRVFLETLTPESEKCAFCGKPLNKKYECDCEGYRQVRAWLKTHYANSSIEIVQYEVADISASGNYCHSFLVDDDRFELIYPEKVKVEDFDYCTRIADKKSAGIIMLSRAWEKDGHICFFTHREGHIGVYKVCVDKTDLDFTPVYHVKLHASKFTYEVIINCELTPDVLISRIMAIELPA